MRATSIGLAASAILMVGAGAWLGVDAKTAIRRAEAAGNIAGAGLRVTVVERDLARLGLAANRRDDSSMKRRLDDLRAGLSTVLLSETTAGRLGPADLAFVAGALERLNTTAALVSGNTVPTLDTAEIERRLAQIADDLRALEARSALASREALTLADNRALQVAFFLGVGALLGICAALLRPRTPQVPDNALMAVERAEMDRSVRLARARFVLMMSHELRTPLNGVLGLLALMKESSPPPAMRPIIGQAERAGQQLASMLHDMLEVESGEATGPAAVTDSTFRPADIAQAMEDLYTPLAGNGHPSFRATVAGDVPPVASGDGVRFQRAVSHLCSHVMETAGVEDVALEVSHDGGECRAALSFAHRAGPQAGLRLVEPAPGAAGAGDETTGVGLGPLLARGLLEQMGGRLEIMTLDSGRIMVLASTPSQAIECDVRPRVRILAQTRSLDALGAAAAASAGVQILSADSEPPPDIVLVEAGGEEEALVVREARARWPSAHLAALGMPDAPAAFDRIIALPLEPARVAAAVAEAWHDCQQQAEAVAQPARALRVG